MPVSIGGYSPIPPIVPTSVGKATPTAGGADFGSALKDAVGALGQLGAQADASSLSLAQGKSVDLHEVMLNTEQASLGFSMALQVRNKLVDAYAEVMRMSV
jgi:flagellar hook-basal body complex protein FliE